MVMALSRGADDFMAKPFDLDVLVAKVQALIRRSYSFGKSASILEHKGAVLNMSSGSLTYEMCIRDSLQSGTDCFQCACKLALHECNLQRQRQL